MIVDKPLEYKDLDTQTQDKLEEIKDIIENLRKDSGNSSVTISINGFWGSGKSSYILGLKEIYESSGSRVIYFDAWRYANEADIFIALLELLYQESTSTAKRFLKRVIKNIGVATLVGADVMLRSILKRVGDIEYGAKEVAENFKIVEDSIEKFSTTYNKNRELLEKVFGQLCDDKNPLVLLIDDLDRLEPKKAYELLERLRFYFDFKNVVVVMAINDEVINSHAHNLQEIQAPKAMKEAFIDKIFHYSVELPFESVNGLHLRSIQRCNDGLYSRVLDVLGEFNLKLSHRKWINIANRLEVVLCKDIDTKDGLLNEEVNIKKGVAIAILKELYSEFNYLYRSSQEALFDKSSPLIEEIKKDLKPEREAIFEKVYGELVSFDYREL